MVNIDVNKLRKDLVNLYETYLQDGKDAIKEKATELYNKYHRPADDELLDEDVCKGIQALYSVAWEDIAKISKTKEHSKEDIQNILVNMKSHL